MIFDDMRQFIKKAEEIGEYKKIEGADWEEEIGLICEWQAAQDNCPLLLFDKIKGYPAGYRVSANAFATPRRTTMALGLEREVWGLDLVRALRDKMNKGFKMIPPVEVKTAPVKENIILGDDVDVFKFPTPKWHHLDGGRYFGTGHAVITKDPDEGWVNLGQYRVQLHSKRQATLYTLPGRHSRQMMDKWWAKGKSCPAAVATGLEPVLLGTAHFDVPWGISEYDYAGGWRGKPLEVTQGETVDIPIPATAEIVLEGEFVEGETLPEGPFGEYTGYYASGIKPMPVFRVNAILHRNDPILHGAQPLMQPGSHSLAHHFRRTANAWNELDKLVRGIKGVWMMDYAGYSPVVVSVEQKYEGHAKQVAMAVLSIYATAFLNRFVIIVDDDIDPSNPAEVFWAMATRCDPATSIDIIRGVWGSDIDPRIHPDLKAVGEVGISTAIILACKPFAWRHRFPPTIMSAPEKIKEIQEKWGALFGQ